MAMFLNIAIAQKDSLTSEYLGIYSAEISREELGNETQFFIGLNGDKYAVYESVYGETNHYAAHYKVNSFDKEIGRLEIQYEVGFFTDEGLLVSINDYGTYTLELFFILKGNEFILRIEGFDETDFIKTEIEEAIILDKKGLPIVVKY